MNTTGKFHSKLIYDCYAGFNQKFLLDSCLSGYNITWYYSQEDSSSNYVKCQLPNKHPTDYMNQKIPCGNSSAQMIGGRGESYCCVYK